MDKISRILPSNQRVTTVDLKNSGVARPGMPNWGREVGVPTGPSQRLKVETSDLAVGKMKDQLGARKLLNDPKAQIVDDLAKEFFIKQQMRNQGMDPNAGKGAANTGSGDETQGSSGAPTNAPVEGSEATEATASDVTVQATPEEPVSVEADAPATGQYLDVHA